MSDESRIVTVIEVLSPANKTTGNRGRDAYVEKQRKVLDSDSHLIEIDLLRGGLHTVAVAESELKARGKYDYLLCLHRARSVWFDVWACTVRQRLPRFAVPLADGDPDLVVDLQALFNRVYDEGVYARRIDYRKEPPLLLRSEDVLWADALLREKGLREPYRTDGANV